MDILIGSILKWSVMLSLSIIHFCNALIWHDLLIGKNKCTMQKMDPTEKYYYILLWKSPEMTSKHVKLDLYFENHTLYENESCLFKNCLFTHSMDLINIKKYDVILFNGRNINTMTKKDLPSKNPNQVFGFVQLESAQNFPINNELFNDFFHLTITYRLDSDLPTPYFKVNYLNGISPKPRKNFRWILTREKLDRKLKRKIYGKTKLAAWFVSRCDALSKRDDFVRQLNIALIELGFNQTVDIFGDCGNLICSKMNHTRCLRMLSKHYMFYLAFENSFDVDYITEKVLNAVNHDTVPIVYGGAEYNRFLPQGSYIDACQLGPRYLAGLMVSLFNNREIYENFFKWRHLYAVTPTELDFAGPLCSMLNNDNIKNRRYKQFTNWWNRQKKHRCNVDNKMRLEIYF